MSILPCATFISPGNPFYGNSGGGIPIETYNTYQVLVSLPAGENSTVLVLDTSDPAKFPPSTNYFFTLTSRVPGSGTFACDTTRGQFSAMGIFQIGNNNQYTSFLCGSAVNTLTTTVNNPRDFYFNNNNPITQPPGIYLYTTSQADFIGTDVIFTWTESFNA